MRPTGSPSPRDDAAWLPLGSAQLVDWKFLGRPGSSRGATAWLGRIELDTVLVRTWTNEATTFYEFYFLAYEDLTGTLVISTARPEPTRLRLQASIEVEGRLGYSDISEFQEHSRTGLYGSILRTVEVTHGELHTDRISSPTATHAEIFEYAPESALSTACGHWIHDLFVCVRDQLLEGEADPMEDTGHGQAVTPAPVVASEPPKSRRARESIDAPPSESRRAPKNDAAVSAPPTPLPAPAPRRAPAAAAPVSDRLLANTNTGDSWELVEQETFIGRSKQCGIVLKSQRVSRKHASITHEPDGYYINDLGAANGIWAGTEKIDREKIDHGAEYIIGDVLITFSYA